MKKIISMFILLSMPLFANSIYNQQDMSKMSTFQQTETIKKIINGNEFENAAMDFIKQNNGKVLNVDDLYKLLVDFLGKALGPEISDLILKLSGIPEFKQHVMDLYGHLKMVTDVQKCDEGFRDSMEDLSWIAAYALAYYYIKMPVVPALIAGIASKMILLTINITNLDEKFCHWIHPGNQNYLIYGY